MKFVGVEVLKFTIERTLTSKKEMNLCQILQRGKELMRFFGL